MIEENQTVEIASGLPSNVNGMDDVALRSRAQTLTKCVSVAYTELMEILYVVHKEKHYKGYGFRTMQGWVETELGFSYGKAQQFFRIWDRLVKQVGCSPEDLRDCGEWTKLRSIAQAVDSESIDAEKARELIQEAKTMKRDEFDEKMRDIVEKSPDTVHKKIVQVTVTEEQYDLWMKVVAKIRSESDRSPDNQLSVSAVFGLLCLSCLLTEFTKSTTKIAFFLRALERTYPDRALFAVPKEIAKHVQLAIDRIQHEIENQGNGRE